MNIEGLSLPSWKQGHPSAPRRGRRITAILALSLFVAQFSLSLLLHPINQILCLEELNGSPAAMHHHNDEAALPHSHTVPDGDAMQHCKDVVFGIAVTPLQPFSLPFATTPQALTSFWANPTDEVEPLCERTLAPPLQPPRA